MTYIISLLEFPATSSVRFRNGWRRAIRRELSLNLLWPGDGALQTLTGWWREIRGDRGPQVLEPFRVTPECIPNEAYLLDVALAQDTDQKMEAQAQTFRNAQSAIERFGRQTRDLHTRHGVTADEVSHGAHEQAEFSRAVTSK